MDHGRQAAAPNLGLRERNRQRAMRQIQDVALDLFDEHGFADVTVEQIAAAADVSPSTVYRYFGTKDRLILHDEEDRVMVDILLGAVGRGATMIDAARDVIAAMRPVLGPDNTSLRRRFRYMVDEPTVRAAMTQESQAVADQVSAEICRLRERDPHDLEVMLSVTTLLITLLLAIETWRRHDFAGDLATILLDCLDILERGITI